jgi:hypothetical protein
MKQGRAYEELLVGRLDIPNSDERPAETLRSELHQDS